MDAWIVMMMIKKNKFFSHISPHKIINKGLGFV